MTYVIQPVFDQTMAARVAMIPVFWFFLRWIYGAFTGLFVPPLRRAFVTVQERAEEIKEVPPMPRTA
jgi:hypothetical protein